MKFERNTKPFTILGIEFTVDLLNITDINVRKKLFTIKNQLIQWSKRSLTPFGKITVIKSLILSQITHILTSLPNPSDKMLKEINNMFYDFLWDQKPDKVKRKIANLKLIDGGLGMVDIYTFIKSLKTTWLRRNYTSNCKWKEILANQQPHFNNLYRFGPEYVKLLISKTTNKFWVDVLEAYFQLTKMNKIISQEEFKASSFMYNDNIKINKCYITNDLLQNNGIQYIHQLMNGNSFLSFNDFKDKYSIEINFLTYYSLITAISRYKTKLDIKENTTKTKTLNYQPAMAIIFKYKRGASFIYSKMIEKIETSKGILKWWKTNTFDQKLAFSKLKKTTEDTKLRWLQFRLLHNILTTNLSVSKFKPNQSHLCEFCKKEKESIKHLFWACPHVQQFWKDVEQKVTERNPLEKMFK